MDSRDRETDKTIASLVGQRDELMECLEDIAEALYQLEDPRGCCRLQDIRMMAERAAYFHASNIPKNPAIREEFVRSITG